MANTTRLPYEVAALEGGWAERELEGQGVLREFRVLETGLGEGVTDECLEEGQPENGVYWKAPNQTSQKTWQTNAIGAATFCYSEYYIDRQKLFKTGQPPPKPFLTPTPGNMLM